MLFCYSIFRSCFKLSLSVKWINPWHERYCHYLLNELTIDMDVLDIHLRNGIPGFLDFGCWTLDARPWTLDTIVDCCWTELEPSFWFCLIKLLEILSMQISNDHCHACSVETIGSDVAIFRNFILTLSVTL